MAVRLLPRATAGLMAVIGLHCVLLAVPVAANPPARVEIVAMSPDMRESAQAVGGSLDKEDGISIVEPEGINDAGASAPTAAPAPPANVDVEATLETVGRAEGASRSLVAFDAISGLRLCDIELPGVTGQVLDDAIADGLRQAVKRHGKTVPPGHAISLLPVRNVDLLASQADCARNLENLFGREMCAAASTAVLERERLWLINERVQRQSAPARSTLFSAPTLIQLELAQDTAAGVDHLQATATLTDRAGKPLGTVSSTGSTNDLPALAHALAIAVQAALANVPPEAASTVGDNIESSRFYIESRAAAARRNWQAATSAAEAAVALAPGVGRFQIQLTNLLIADAVRQANPPGEGDVLMAEPRTQGVDWDTTLHLMHRGSQLLLASGKISNADAKLQASVALLREFIVNMIAGDQASSGLSRPDDQGQFDTPRFTLTDEQRTLLSSTIWNYRNYVANVLLPVRLAAVDDRPSFERYTESLLELLGDDCHIFSKSQSAYAQSAARRLIEWAPLAGLYASPRLDNSTPIEIDLDSVPAIWVEDHHNWLRGWSPPCFGKVSAADAKEWEKVADALERAKAPERFYINLRNWARSVENPPTDAPPAAQVAANAAPPPTDIAPPSPDTASPPPDATAAPAGAPAKPLPLVYSKSIPLIDTKVGQADPWCINKPIVVGDQLFVAALGNAADGDNEVRLMQGPIDGSQPLKIISRLSHVPDDFATSCRNDGNSFFESTHFLGSEHLIISTDQGLIFVLSRDNTAQCMIDAAKELPGKVVQSATDLGDTIYIVVTDANAGACLVSYDLRTHQTQTLASSSRRAAVSPLDNIAPMSVSWMFSDPPHDRIVFFAYQSTWDDSKKGLWEFSHKTGKFRKLLGTTYSRVEGGGGFDVIGSPVADHTFELLTGQTLIYDLNADGPTDDLPPSLSSFHSPYEEPTVYQSWWHRYGDPGGAGVGTGDNTLQQRVGDVHALKELWQGAYAQFSMNVPPSQLLVADWAGIWVITPQ